MGFLATVVSFTRSVFAGAQAPECTVDRDGGETLTALHLGAPGDDAAPLPGDVAYLGSDEGSGAAQIVAYQDPSTPGVAAPGERRIYSRSGPGVVAAELWLKADGTLVAKNASGSLELGPDGSGRLVNPLGSIALDAAGLVTWTTPLGTNGAATHQHGTPFGPTTPPIPGT
jgi:hypothetical protein